MHTVQMLVNNHTLVSLHHYLPEIVDGEVRFPVAVIFTKISSHHISPLLYCISDSVSSHHDELHTVIFWYLSIKYINSHRAADANSTT